MLVQPMASLTDFALGLVSLYLVWRLPRGGELSRHWRAAFAWAAGTALAGAVYHGVFVGIPWLSDLSWAVMSIMVVVVVSYLLAASVVQVLERSRAVVFWLLRSVGLVTYVVLAAAGHASITAIMWCESLTMASVLGLWIWAWCRRHPMGGPMLVAIGASIAAAMLRLVPGAAALAGLDPDSAYHLGQIGGMVMLYHAVARAGGRSDATARLTPAGDGAQSYAVTRWYRRQLCCLAPTVGRLSSAPKRPVFDRIRRLGWPLPADQEVQTSETADRK